MDYRWDATFGLTVSGTVDPELPESPSVRLAIARDLTAAVAARITSDEFIAQLAARLAPLPAMVKESA